MIGGSQEGRPLFSQHETACFRAEAQETQRAEPPAEASPDQYDFSHVGSRRFMSLLTRRAPAISASSCEGSKRAAADPSASQPSIWRLATGYSGRIVTTLPSAHARYAICQAEEEVRSLLEASVTAANEGKSHEALGAGIQAVKKERHLRKLLRQAHLLQRHDPELTFAVVLNLANRHQACQNFPEAISAYGSLMRQYRNTAETSAL
ncbi:hypothetical protein TGDOM2_207407 [Toxoplasma gondii GAB2-2007-GAL-DOM2]|uniref:Tetratricopeptide repeat-containing protein n=4 Tax=Toxoplasma gondii TaxID=5811 RepID=S7UIW4_TOXGG|nr:hypothetical protein TGGT1_207407 [Toxoplasma gondii GT1]KAF4646037.1 hypothetical protein TGRH88_023140 [Toxoplasma gondii]KFG35227.1 hypothetical protein TGDOM2_207407 [Toxoplasma gondii GAB2-2007-GAL-DOM2]KFG48996.1 hypothetical protein TGFOU_207407 [Toxoplasma gondii FOU]